MKQLLIALQLALVSVLALPPFTAAAISPSDREAILKYNNIWSEDSVCSLDSVATPQLQPGKVVVIGDSIANGGREVLNGNFSSNGWSVVAYAEDGRTAPEGPDVIQDQARIDVATARAVVVQLGTNPSTGDFRTTIEETVNAIRKLAPTARIFWIDLASHNREELSQAHTEANAALYELSPASELNFSVVPWFKEVFPNGEPTASMTELVDSKDYINDTDGFYVHPTEAGYAAWGELLRSSVTGFGDSLQEQEQAPVSDTTAMGASQVAVSVLGESWASNVRQAVEANRPVYEQAAAKNDVPWTLIATIHYVESGLKLENPRNGQGIYQFYQKQGGPYPPGPVSQEEFLRQTNFMAQRLKEDYQNRTPYEPNKNQLTATGAPPEAIKDLLFSYNGRAGAYLDQAANFGFDRISQGYEGSPYVVNYADDRRNPEKNLASGPPSGWGQVRSDGGGLVYPAVEGFLGTYFFYAFVSGDTTLLTDAACDNTELRGDLRARIVEIARRELEGGAKESDQSYFKYTDDNAEKWCANFVSWVFREAGAPFTSGIDGWRIPAVQGILDLAVAEGKFQPKGNGYQPQPGDVAIYKEGLLPFKSHVNIVISSDGSSFQYIGGNEGDTIQQGSHSLTAADLTGFYTP